MKASDMTNEELANELKKPLVGSRIMIEAAVRLRKLSALEQAVKVAGETAESFAIDNNALRARLKTAEDALEYAKGSITRDCMAYCSHVNECARRGNTCLCENKINSALAAIREEGGDDGK